MAKTDVNDKIIINKLVTGVKSLSIGTQPDSSVPNKLTGYYNQSITELRKLNQILEAIRTLSRTHGDASAAVSALLRLANTRLKFRVYDMEHQLSGDGSALLRSVLTRMDYMSDYGQGFDDRMSLDTIKSVLLRDVILTGANALELVLDQQRLPYRLQPVSVETLKWKASKTKIGSGYKLIPVQEGGAEPIELNIPTFFYQSLDQDLTSAYSYSPIEPALNTAIFHSESVDDIRRVVRRSGHSRLLVKLVTEEVLKSAPLDVRGDPAKLSAWVESVRQNVIDNIETLSPESALVVFDSIEASYLNSEIGASADYKPLVEIIDSLLATSLKTPPAIVGKRMSGGSQNTSSTESLLFIKTAEGLHTPVQATLSRALTLAVRLLGFEGYVDVKFEPIDLRPEVELNAFHTMRQQLILEQLSYGFITDDEAGELLGTGPRAPGAPPLSGTMFLNPATQDSKAPSPNGDPARRAMTTDAPKSAGGKDNSSKRS